ncbi:MAG: hypothetical protein Q7J85_11485 [Bacillota bacterium]|nr:hypothetical protein [Bacillota bacterium]
MNDLTQLINSALSKELHALIYLLGYQAQKGSFKVYAVGGFVRDLLLGKENRDIDLVVDGNAVEFAKSMLPALPGRLQSYERFGTAKLLLSNGIVFDMVTARTEFYSAPGALPTVEQSTLKNDLFRRDFTINTMACALNPEGFGKLYDYFGGMDDLEKGIIRVLYNLSFVDDPLRILRAVRFEQRFDFTIDEDSLSLLHKARRGRLLEKVSKERLYKETRLFFREPLPGKVLTRLEELKLFNSIFPRLIFDRETKERIGRLDLLLPVFGIERSEHILDNLVLYLSALFYELSEHDLGYFFYLMRLKKTERLKIVNILSSLPEILPQIRTPYIKRSHLYSLLEKLPPEGLALIICLEDDIVVSEHVIYYWEHLSGRKPFITGKDLLEAGMMPGPLINQILTRLQDAVLDGKVYGREEELEFVTYLLENNSLIGRAVKGDR